MLKKIINPLIIFSFSFSQNVQLNEIVSSNQNTYYDEDGDTPDWIELYNSTSNNISLNNWGLSDNVDDPFKWRIPNVIIGPEDFLMIMASDKDRTDMISEAIIIRKSSESKIILGIRHLYKSSISSDKPQLFKDILLDVEL